MKNTSQLLCDSLQQRFAESLLDCRLQHGEVTIEVDSGDYTEICVALRDEATFHFEQLIDLCGVDYSQYGREEWETTASSSTGFSPRRGKRFVGAPIIWR